jgi:uncharacterized protein (TIGR02271 family)
MESTIIGVYDEYSQAQNALNELMNAGLSHSDIELISSPDGSASARQGATRPDEQSAGQSSGGFSFSKLFSSLFGGSDKDDHGDIYSEAVRRGSYVLSVQAKNDNQHAEIINIMDRFNPVDIDERAAHWRSQGWMQHDASAPALTDDEVQIERSGYRARQPSLQQTGMQDAASSETLSSEAQMMQGDSLKEQTRIPVVEEELQVGKREVQRGGVRVFQRVIEKPVNESVQLREEHVKVERRPVNQHATPADMAAFKEGSIELRENAEQAVIGKTARVVEEVVVGKEVGERTENINDSVRHTEVEVEQLGAMANSGMSTSRMDDDSDFRNHWRNNFGSTGGRYEDYDSAYRYGSTMAGNERYKNHQWSDVEPQLRGDWESSHPGSDWEKVKDAVRYGAERGTGNRRH